MILEKNPLTKNFWWRLWCYLSKRKYLSLGGLRCYELKNAIRLIHQKEFVIQPSESKARLFYLNDSTQIKARPILGISQEIT